MSLPISTGPATRSGFQIGIRRLALVLAMAGLLTGCADDRVAGASTETTNGLTGTVRDARGAPVANARVAVWNARGDSLLALAGTDAAGRWGAPAVTGVVGIQAYSRDSTLGGWIGGERIEPDDSVHDVDLRMDAVSQLTVPGHLRGRLAGTPWRTLDGRFRRIPSGAYTLLADTSYASRPLGSAFVAPATHDTLEPSSDSGLLVEDFDDGDSTWIFGPVLDRASRWFTQTSPRGAALFYPLADESTATPGIQDSGAWKGRSLRMRYYSADTGSFVQAGIYFRKYLDLSELRSIRVRLKGDGLVRFGLSGYGMPSGRAVWEATPGDSWQEFTFRPGEELPAGDADPPHAAFASISHAVFLLMIQAYGGSQLWIDDIRFDGIEPEICLP